MSFSSPIDIANRALQHCGSPRISTFQDNSKAAAESGFIYDKVRRAELRRHIWQFSTRRTALRPITATSQNIHFGAWSTATAYPAGSVVTAPNLGGDETATWIAIQATTGNTPNATPLDWQEYFGPLVADTWSATLSYSTGELVLDPTSGFPYLSLVNSNINNLPPSTGTTTAYWLYLSNAIPSTLFLPNPITANQAGVLRLAYRLPAGFLRVASQDVKAAGVNYLATSGGMQWSDFEIEDRYLISAVPSPIIFRFAADIEDVTRMDDLFCEGLAARMALGLVETLTQSPQKMQMITQSYERFMTEARRISAIEVGSTEPPDSEYQFSRQTDANAPGAMQPQQQR